MPFDGTETTPAIRRARLIEALRREMPEGVQFDYLTVRCGSAVCALGLASLIWPEHESMLLGGVECVEDQAAFFGIDRRDATNIFWGQGGIYRPRSGTIAPAMVADALEKTEA